MFEPVDVHRKVAGTFKVDNEGKNRLVKIFGMIQSQFIDR